MAPFAQKMTNAVRIDSQSLDLAGIVAVSRLAVTANASTDRTTDVHDRYGAHAYLDDECLHRISSSTKNLEESLAKGKIIYGKRIFIFHRSGC